MIAIVYSGSKFADWRFASRGKIVAGFQTPGLNPNLHDERYIHQALNNSNSLINHAEELKKIYFFGAGSSSPERKKKIQTVFELFFKNAKIYIDQDITASAIATLGDHRGLIGVLGSGSNAALYDGRKIQEENYGLGYILADEGSSNWLGRQLLKSFLTETMPEDVRKLFVKKHPLDQKQVMEKVYNNANPTLFLTSFSDFIEENAGHPFIQDMVQQGFRLFIETYLIPLRQKHPNTPIHMTGSVAGTHEDDLRAVALEYELTIELIVKEPIHQLVNYYIHKR